MGRNGPVGCWCPCFSSPHASSSPAEGFANSASSSSDSEATLPLPPSRRSASSGKGFALADAGSSQLPPAATLLPLPPHPAFPHHAVGIEDQVDRVIRLLEWEEEANVAVAVVLHGFGGTGKTTLADAVVATLDLQGWDCFAVVPNSHESTDGSVGDGSHEAERAFIYMDSDSALPRKKDVEKLLPKSCKRLRILLTARDEMAADVISGCECGIRTKVYPVRPLHSQDAMKLLTNKLGVKAEIPQHQMNEIVEVCDGVPVVVERVGAYICQSPDKGEAFRRVIEWSKGGKAFSTAEDQFSIEKKGLLFDLEKLPPSARESFLDVCSFFNGWDWDKVSCIVGEDELTSLRNRALLYSYTEKEECAGNKVKVRPIISTIGRNITRGKRFTSTDELTKVLEGNSLVRKQICHDHHSCIKFPFASHTVSAPITYPSAGAAQDDIGGIKGIWLQHNLSEPFLISADNLDLMHNSLRVLALGDMTIVVGDQCKQKFPHIIYFQAGMIPRIPLRPTDLQGLRFLDWVPNNNDDSQLAKMSTTLKVLLLDGRRRNARVTDIASVFTRLQGLRILKLAGFETWKILPEELSLLTQLEELDELPDSFGKLKSLKCLKLFLSLKELPDSFVKLRCLRYLNLSESRLERLPEDFGSLTFLEELSLGCPYLKRLPSSFEKLSSLRVLDLRNCRHLKYLPDDIGNLPSLLRIKLEWSGLRSIPPSLQQLSPLPASVSLKGCEKLKDLPEEFCCHLKLVKDLSFENCRSLSGLPKRLVELASLTRLDLSCCTRLQSLPEGFGQLKSLAVLVLDGCDSLQHLSADFHCLASLRKLIIRKCMKLGGEWMDTLAKIKTLDLVDIVGSNMLVKRWAEMEMEMEGELWQFSVRASYEMGWEHGENLLNKAALNLLTGKCLLENSREEPFSLSTVAPNTVLLVMYEHCKARSTWRMMRLLEEIVMANQSQLMPFQIICVGKSYGQLANRILAYAPEESEAFLLFSHLLEVTGELVVTEVVADGGGRKRFSSWESITESGMTFLLSKSTLYSDLQKLSQTPQESNVKLLTALFGTEESRATPIFIKNCTESVGVDKLLGKTILLLISHIDKHPLEALTEIYSQLQSSNNLEIISIAIPHEVHGVSQLSVFDSILREVPWPVLRNPWLLKTEVCYFIEREWGELNPGILVVVDPNGKICNKNALPLIETWGAEVCPFTQEKMKQLEEVPPEEHLTDYIINSLREMEQLILLP